MHNRGINNRKSRQAGYHRLRNRGIGDLQALIDSLKFPDSCFQETISDGLFSITSIAEPFAYNRELVGGFSPVSCASNIYGNADFLISNQYETLYNVEIKFQDGNQTYSEYLKAKNEAEDFKREVARLKNEIQELPDVDFANRNFQIVLDSIVVVCDSTLKKLYRQVNYWRYRLKLVYRFVRSQKEKNCCGIRKIITGVSIDEDGVGIGSMVQVMVQYRIGHLNQQIHEARNTRLCY